MSFAIKHYHQRIFSHRALVQALALHRQHASTSATFKASDLELELSKELQSKPDPTKLVFGKHYTDHMLSVDWTAADGWGPPRIHPVRHLSLHPGAKVLHYAVELFEGMKAYRGAGDGRIRVFRPEMNMARMNLSAKRAFLPNFEGKELLACIKKLISVDADWVPDPATGSTLYIRPTLIGTEKSLGVAATSEALLFVLLGPVGPYYPTGLKPISLMANPNFVRAAHGGCGDVKMGSNYGPTIFVQKAAEAEGCQQALWLYGEDHQITEVGTMNIFMRWTNPEGEEELVTPPLSGIILPGVTRASLLDMARSWGEFKVSERVITMKELVQGLQEGRVKEVFGAGTACVVSPVKSILYITAEGKQMLDIPTMEQTDALYARCLQGLTDIQFGRTPGPPGWVQFIDE